MLIAIPRARSSHPAIDILGPPRTSRGMYLLGLILVALMVMRLWVFDTFVFTPELLTKMYEGSLDEVAIAERLRFRQSSLVWGYLTTPLALIVRVAVVAALAQTILLLFGREVPFGSTLRAFLFAHSVVVAASLTHVLYLTTIPQPQLNASDLWIPFDSILNFVDEARLHPLLASSGDLLSVSEMLWVALASSGLIRLAGLSRRFAFITVMAVWLVSAAFRVAVSVYAQHLIA